MTKGTIIYIGGFRFPDGNAAAKLALNYARIFTALDYRVVFVGADDDSDTSVNVRKRTVQDYDVWTFERAHNFRGRLRRFFGIQNILSVVSAYDDIKIIICYNFRSVPFLRVIAYCRKNGIKVISNTTEWYGKTGRNVVFDFFRNIDTILRMYVANRHVDGLIVTSSFLRDFYGSANVVVVPSLSESFSSKNAVEPKGNREKVHLVYAGNPFCGDRRIKERSIIKDRLDKIISYLYKVFIEGYDFQFHIYGVTREQYLRALPEDQYMLDALKGVYFHGFVKGDAVYSAILNADFTVLVRDVNRVTLAGFPTKIAESINLGIPVLTTKIGDMDKYVTENKTGFFFDTDDDDYNISVLRRVLAMDYDEIDAMKRYCRESTVFRGESWLPPFAEFFNKI